MLATQALLGIAGFVSSCVYCLMIRIVRASHRLSGERLLLADRGHSRTVAIDPKRTVTTIKSWLAAC